MAARGYSLPCLPSVLSQCALLLPALSPQEQPFIYCSERCVPVSAKWSIPLVRELFLWRAVRGTVAVYLLQLPQQGGVRFPCCRFGISHATALGMHKAGRSKQGQVYCSHGLACNSQQQVTDLCNISPPDEMQCLSSVTWHSGKKSWDCPISLDLERNKGKDCILCKIFWKTNGLELLVLWFSVKWLVEDGLLKRSQADVKQFWIITHKVRIQFNFIVWNGAFQKLNS